MAHKASSSHRKLIPKGLPVNSEVCLREIKCSTERPSAHSHPHSKCYILDHQSPMPRLFSIPLGPWEASGNRASGPAGAPLPSLPSPLFGTEPCSPLEPTVCSSYNAGASRQEWWEEKPCQLHVSEAPSICICQRNKKKINARKRQLRWGCSGTAADSLPLSSKGPAIHASEPQTPVVTFRMQAMALRRPFCHRAAGAPGSGAVRATGWRLVPRQDRSSPHSRRSK